MYQTIPKRILRCSHGLWSRRAMASRLNQMFLQSRDPEIQRYRLWQLKVRHLATWFLLVKNWLGLLHCSQHLHGRRKHSTWLVPLNHQIRLLYRIYITVHKFYNWCTWALVFVLLHVAINTCFNGMYTCLTSLLKKCISPSWNKCISLSFFYYYSTTPYC